MLLHDDTLGDIQPHAGPLAGRFGGVKRVENVRLDSLRNARPIITTVIRSVLS